MLVIKTQTHRKIGFVTAAKFGTTDKIYVAATKNFAIFVAATKNFATASKRFVDRTKHLVFVTKCFCYLRF